MIGEQQAVISEGGRDASQSAPITVVATRLRQSLGPACIPGVPGAACASQNGYPAV